jgi:rubrerythrin
MEASMKRGRALLVMGLVGVLATMTVGGRARAEEMKVGTTLENLMVAYNGESNASARYAEFAKKAEADGYLKVAQLFRATSASEKIHAGAHAAVIKKMGGTPQATIDSVKVGTTRENLEASLQGEIYEKTTMYPKFLEKARSDANKDAMRSINYAKASEEVHAKFYQAALDKLASYKEAGPGWFVCQVCGFTVTKVDFAKCPVCFNPKEKYKLIS